MYQLIFSNGKQVDSNDQSYITITTFELMYKARILFNCGLPVYNTNQLCYQTTTNGIAFDIIYKNNHAAVIPLMENEDNYFLTKEDLREMSFTAKIKGIEEVHLFTNYGIELNSKYEKPLTIGFNTITKIVNQLTF